LDKWLQAVLWESRIPWTASKEQSTNFVIHRLKGKITLDNGEVKMIQGVREVFDIIKVLVESRDQAEEQGKIVMIGKHLAGIPWESSLITYLEQGRHS
jgi:G3E family GTPase